MVRAARRWRPTWSVSTRYICEDFDKDDFDGDTSTEEGIDLVGDSEPSQQQIVGLRNDIGKQLVGG